jgi:hypothetical protein
MTPVTAFCCGFFAVLLVFAFIASLTMRRKRRDELYRKSQDEEF